MASNFTTTLTTKRLAINYLNGHSSTLSAGDVVVFDSSDPNNATVTTTENDTNVIGVIVGEDKGVGELVFVVSQGIATVKVTGAVAKGDYLITSTTAGRAKSATAGRLLGVAITANTSGNGTVEAIILAGVVGGDITDHATLTNLDSTTAHTQYALLAGNSGGQTLDGGTASGEDLTLSSTANATKGSIIMGTSYYDETNDRLGIQQSTPQAMIHIGDKVLTNNPYSSDDLGLLIASDSENPLIALVGAAQASIALQDLQATADQGIIQMVTNNETTKFRVLSDNLSSVTTDDILCIDHSNGNVSIGINTSSATAILKLNSTTKGFLPPKMTTVQRDAIASPEIGLVIFNTTTDRLEVYADNSSSNRWEDMSGNAA